MPFLRNCSSLLSQRCITTAKYFIKYTDSKFQIERDPSDNGIQLLHFIERKKEVTEIVLAKVIHLIDDTQGIKTKSPMLICSQHYLLEKKKRLLFLRDFQGILSMKY